MSHNVTDVAGPLSLDRMRIIGTAESAEQSNRVECRQSGGRLPSSVLKERLSGIVLAADDLGSGRSAAGTVSDTQGLFACYRQDDA